MASIEINQYKYEVEESEIKGAQRPLLHFCINILIKITQHRIFGRCVIFLRVLFIKSLNIIKIMISDFEVVFIPNVISNILIILKKYPEKLQAEA
ncbi:hypothetical protein ACNAN0_01035 [Agrilactobacillus fermenti]|uniref:hypothetical protein n=1 Tax=Agrilactobacillus fermenti TaxID=2586909 RepID=UPI001E46AEFF|nr:hypothetical protein [Agrilactobacillus fermenti]MCD2256501.1 hypothetical protein [Agrilactobacillus fermenti]